MSNEAADRFRSARMLVAVPPEVVPELVEACDGVLIPDLRSSAVDVALVVGANATSVISLVLSARAVAALSRAVTEIAATADRLTLRGQFGNRRVDLTVDDDCQPSDIGGFIAEVEAPPEINPEKRVRGVRVFVSYAHDNDEHKSLVKRLWCFLREEGIDARIDLWAECEPRDWTLWTHDEIRAATFVLLIASPAFKRRAEGPADSADGRGVQWEAQLLRELRYRDPIEARRKQLPVVLPGRSANELPDWASPTAGTHFTVHDFTDDGAKDLLKLFRGAETREH